MGKETNEEREFSPNIDRLLAGGEVKAGEDMSEDYRTVLDFAQKLTRLRDEPSLHFTAQLKERLLWKLAEQETEAARQEEKGNWFWEGLRNLMGQNPVWRTAAATLVIMMLAAGALWGTGLLSPSPAPITAPPTAGLNVFIEADVTPDKDTYLPGEEIVVEFSFKNVASELFPIDPFPPGVEIVRPSPYDEIVRSFPAGTATKSLAPGEVASYTIAWDQRDDQEQQVSYGYYSLKLGCIRLRDDAMSLDLSESRRLVILPPEGVMEKVIQVNQSQTVSGVTFTLERVELSALKARFYAFNVPPDYSPPQDLNAPPPRLTIHANAEYSLDGGSIKEAGSSEIRFLENGMVHTWDLLAPVPKGTRELTVTITNLADQQGPWEFVISLQD